MAHLGAPANWESVGQVYPRGLDFEVVSVLIRLSAARQFCQDLADHGRARAAWKGVCQGTNRFVRNASQDEQQKLRANQRLSSHPQRSLGHGFGPLGRSMERRGRFLFGGQAGRSTRCVFRLGRLARYLPDGALSNGGFPRRDQGRVPPVSPLFVVDHFHDGGGQGRIREGEDAHAAIKEHALATVKDLRAGKIKENDLPARLAKDKRIGLDAQAIGRLIKKGKKRWVRPRPKWINSSSGRRPWGERYPASKEYTPPTML